MTAPEPSKAWAAWTTVAAVVLPMVLYIFTAAPGPYWLDSGELAAAAWMMGIPHPPGHPMYTATANAFGLIPGGSIALRMNLASGMCMALCCGVLAFCARRLLVRIGLSAKRAAIAGLFGAVLAGTTYALWFQGVRAEVYAVHLLMATLLVALTLELDIAAKNAHERDGPDPRVLYSMALVSGLGLANHHYLMVFVGIVVFGLMLARAPLRAMLFSKRGLWAVVFGVLGLSMYLALPLRAAQQPFVNWGSLETFGDFFWLISAQAFQKSVEKVQHVDSAKLTMDLLGQMARQTTPVGLLLAVFGLGWLVVRSPLRSTGVLLTAFIVFNLVTQSLMNFDPNNPDVHGYFALSAWGIALLVTLALGAFGVALEQAASEEEGAAKRLGPWLSATSVVMIGVLGAVNGWMTLPEARLDDFYDVDRVNITMLAAIPPNSLVLTSNYKTVFNLWYAQGVEHRRPDVAVVHRNFFANEPYIRELNHRHPEVTSLIARPGKSNQVAIAELRAAAAKRPIFVEYDINIEDALLPFLVPEGLLFRVSPDPISKRPLPVETVKRQIAHWSGLMEQLRRTGAQPYELETGRYLVWQHYLATKALVGAGHWGLARFHLDQALAINDKSPELIELDALWRERRSTPQ